MNEDKICRNMFVHLGYRLTLCAAVLGVAFYLVAKNGSPTPDYNIRGQAGNQVGSNRGSLLRFERKEKRRKVLVYELGWPDEKDGRAVFRKERYYLDEETGQPRKIEKYFRYEPDGEYVLEGTRIIGESTDEEEAEETE